MSSGVAPFQHPSLGLAVTEPQRERAIDYLQGAYADGRLTADELDQRLGQALGARTRAELNAAFAGLVTIPLSSMAVGRHPAYAPVINQHSDGAPGRFAAGTAHFSGLFTSFFGPAVMYAITSRGSYAHREAAKAFNFQVASAIFLAVAITIAAVTDFGGIIPLGGLAWLLLTITGGARAASGEDWQNPVMRRLPLRLLDETPRRELGR